MIFSNDLDKIRNLEKKGLKLAIKRDKKRGFKEFDINYCNNCGSVLNDDVKKCNNCGRKIKKSSKNEETYYFD